VIVREREKYLEAKEGKVKGGALLSLFCDFERINFFKNAIRLKRKLKINLIMTTSTTKTHYIIITSPKLLHTHFKRFTKNNFENWPFCTYNNKRTPNRVSYIK